VEEVLASGVVGVAAAAAAAPAASGDADVSTDTLTALVDAARVVWPHAADEGKRSVCDSLAKFACSYFPSDPRELVRSIGAAGGGRS